MSRTRNKSYKHGDRINIYLSKDITPEFLNWINKQSDLSSYFLYAVKLLYEKTGNVDVSEHMPKKINFDIANSEDKLLGIVDEKFETNEPKNILDKEKEHKDFSVSDEDFDDWHNVNLDEDPFA